MPQLSKALQAWPNQSPWTAALEDVTADSRFSQILESVACERSEFEVYPPADQMFTAFEWSGPQDTRAVILGQDPYHAPGQAHGLSFSVPEGVAWPKSLRNILREWQSDCSRSLPLSGCLELWARHGVLLLNSLLSVRRGQPLSHRKCGWEWFTDRVLGVLLSQPQRIVFVLWGAVAQEKAPLIQPPHALICSPHPSPLSAHRGFFGSRPFTRVNSLLREAGRAPIDWSL